MKIYELTGYKSNQFYQQANDTFKIPNHNQNSLEPEFSRPNQLHKWNDYMIDHGFKFLGIGNYGSVYEHPTYPWVFKIFKDDPAFLYYVNYIKHNQHNPNVPKIKGNVIKINDSTFVVRLEKLQPISNTFFIHNLAEPISIIRLLKNRNIEDLDKEYQQILAKFKKQYPGIFQIIYDMVKSNYRLDMGSRNMLMRNNTPIVTDPIG